MEICNHHKIEGLSLIFQISKRFDRRKTTFTLWALFRSPEAPIMLMLIDRLIFFLLIIVISTSFTRAADMNYEAKKREYVDLTAQEIDDWYSELEICMLNLDDREMNNRECL